MTAYAAIQNPTDGNLKKMYEGKVDVWLQYFNLNHSIKYVEAEVWKEQCNFEVWYKIF